MRVIIVFSFLLYTPLLWSSQSGPEEVLIEYLDQIQRVNFIEEDRKDNLLDLYFKKSYKTLKKLITPYNARYFREEGPSFFEVYLNYNIELISIEKETAIIYVTYNLVGYIIGGTMLSPRLSEDRVITKLKLVDNEWKVESAFKNIPHAHYFLLRNAKKYFKNRRQSLSQNIINRSVKQLNDLEQLDTISIYNARLSYDTILGLLFFDKMFDLSKGDEEFRDNINAFSRDQLRKLRNAIYAKHQYLFKDKDLIKYYKQQFSSNLYSPNTINIGLSEIDKKNIKFLKNIEQEK